MTMEMQQMKSLSVLLLVGLFVQTAYAQKEKEKEIEISAATSTPFLTEDERTKALISEDRPLLQSYVELEEEIKDNEIDQKDASNVSKRIEKQVSSVEGRMQVIEKQTERRTLVSELEALKNPASEKASVNASDKVPNNSVDDQTEISADKETIGQKETRIGALDIEIDALEAQLQDDIQAIDDQIQTHKTDLEQSLNHQADEQAELAQKINDLNLKLASETNLTKITRIEKQLANEQHRADKLDARIVKLNEKSDALDEVIENVQPDPVILPNTKN